MLEEFSRDSVVVGSCLAAWEYAYSNNYPIISTGAYSPSIINKSEYMYCSKLQMVLGFAGLAPYFGEIKKIELTKLDNPVVSVYSESELLFKMNISNKIHIFNDDALKINIIGYNKDSEEDENRVYEIIYVFYMSPEKPIKEKYLLNNSDIEGLEEYEIIEVARGSKKSYIFYVRMKSLKSNVFDFENSKEATRQFIEYKYKTAIKDFYYDSIIRPESMEVVKNIDFIKFHEFPKIHGNIFESLYNTSLWRIYKHLFETYDMYGYNVDIETKEKEMYEKVLSSKIKEGAFAVNRFDL